MPLKAAIDIQNIWIFLFAKSPIGLILYIYICIHISIAPKKWVWIVDPWHVQQVEPQTLIMEKLIMEKPVNLP